MSQFQKPEEDYDEKIPHAVHPAETPKHIDGNVHLVDNESGAIRHVPIPSASPRDPLNWHGMHKVMVIIACCFFSIMSLSLVGGAGPLIPYWIQTYAGPPELISIPELINLTTWPSLFVGVGNFVFIPLALFAGRRFSLLLASVILLAATVGAGGAQSFDGHLAARILQGLSAGVTESLLPLILTDITFVHQRGKLFGVYWTTQSIASSCLAIASSYEAEALGWRGYYWIFAGLVAVGLILNFFLIPETRFFRPPATIDGQRVVTDAYGEQVVVDEKDSLAHADFSEGYGSASDKPLTFMETLKPWNGVSPNGTKLALTSYIAMAKCLTSPGMLWSVAYSGIILGTVIGFSLTYANVLIQGYGFKESQTGLIQITAIPAGLLAMFYTGLLTDKLAVRSAKKHGGIHQPEARLPILVLPSLVAIVSTVLYGYSAQYPERFGNHWIAPFFFQGGIVFAFTSSLIITTTFAVECCPQAAGPALVIAVGAKNLVAFGLSYGLVPLVTTHGAVYAYGIVLTCSVAAVSALGVVVYFLNPLWRKKTSGHVH